MNCIDSLCSAYAYAMGVEAPGSAAPAHPALTAYEDKAFEGRKADRLFLYNPDAIALWIWEKYAHILRPVENATELELPLCSVMPSVTPVCFGTIYTGAQPEVHGIRKYIKPVIAIDTLFDALIRAGKRPVILAETDSSLDRIFRERDMEYYSFPTVDQVNEKTAQLIAEDRHDVYVVYNGNYDTIMHKFGPESPEALAELTANSRAYAEFDRLIRQLWTGHDTLLGFAMDHGCHEIDGGAGSHGLDMDEDLNIEHLYGIIKAAE